MRHNIKASNWIKKGIAACIVAVLIIQAIVSIITYAQGSRHYDLLGTNEALGSPILNPNFVAEDWNKWEAIVWGVYLSNFAIPLVDDYQSAFDSGSTRGSKGAGYRALMFGSGSDPANAQVIQDLLNYAVTQQKTGPIKPIYVVFNDVARDGFIKNDPSDASFSDSVPIRQAKFKDMFLMSDSKHGDSWIKRENTKDVISLFNAHLSIPIDSEFIGQGSRIGGTEQYVDLATINEGMVPTFYIQHGSGYERVFDYTDGWDAQVLTAWIARIATGDYKGEFRDLFNDMWEKSGELSLGLDCFGNIVVPYNGSNRIVIPASINQHLTASPQINLLSSMLFNGYNTTIDVDELALRGQQSVSGWFFDKDTILGIIDTVGVRYGGLPAFGSHITGIQPGTIMVYYDLDTIMHQTYFHGGELSDGIKTVYDDKGLMPKSGLKTITGGIIDIPQEKAHKVHYGKAIQELFDLDISKSVGNKYMFKIEAANMGKIYKNIFTKDEAGEVLANMVVASGQIADKVGGSVNAKVMTEMITDVGKVKLFNEPVIVPVQMASGRFDSGKLSLSGVGRLYMNYIYQLYKGDKTTTAGLISSDTLRTQLKSTNAGTMKGLKKILLGSDNGRITDVIAGFISEKTGAFRLSTEASKLIGVKPNNSNNPFKKIDGTKINGVKAVEPLYEDNKKEFDYFPGRLVKLYPISEPLRMASNSLGVRDGTESSLYSAYIYMTYLDWYGIKTNRLTGNVTSEFNPRIFDEGSDLLKIDISSVTTIKSAEDKKKEVLEYTYMMLHPTEGKAYRNDMMRSYMSNFIYDTYQKIVYGNAMSYYSGVSSNLATRNATGFLSIDNYSDNFMTAWFMKIYPKAAVFLIATSFILIIIVGLMKGRKTTWFLMALVVVINTILIVPSAGEITPLIANKFVQRMFNDKMTYWSVMESVNNAKMESDYVNHTDDEAGYLKRITAGDKEEAIKLIKSLNIVYLDRALMIKSDISRKVTQTQRGNFEEIQKLRSTRWLLPIIMRQFTANDGSANYVYTPLGDIYDDLSNMYWLYKPEDAAFSGTVNGQQGVVGAETAANVEDPIRLIDRKTYFSDYIDTTTQSAGAVIPYRSEAYYSGKNLNDMPHTYFYLLKVNKGPIKRGVGFGGEYEGPESIERYVERSLNSGLKSSFLSTATLIEQEAGKYDRFDRSTVNQIYGYLWATESPFHYFYQSIKDCFDSDMNIGTLVGKLQGTYRENDDDIEVRTSFMHAGEYGYIRDVLDLQELYTNTLPYLYQMQLTSGGTNGKNGVLGDELIEEYYIYNGNYKSWLFRSNWATKIMESPELTKPAIVNDKNGNRIVIANPTLVDCYPISRPMIFSEAQMHEYGLSEADLNIVELKNVKINKDVSRAWTMMLNYVNIEGMTKEVILRQMATEATLAFNRELSPTGLMNSAYEMYPNGIDLRAISFDSVMKMLMLNITRNTSYVYGDTMQGVISDSDIFSAFLLLSAAFLCSYIIPLVRNITMGLIFYLGFLAILYALLASNKQKAKVTGGYLISNLLFLGMTIGYYAIFNVLMAATSHDSVLTVQSVQVNAGNPVWCFIVIIVVSLAYIAAMFKMIDFCFKHYRDMGMEVYASVAGMITDSISDSIDSLGQKISGYGTDAGTPEHGIGDSIIDKVNEGGQGTFEGGNVDTSGQKPEGSQLEEETTLREYGTTPATAYTFGGRLHDDSADAEEIDKEIEKGKEIGREDKKQLGVK